MRTRRALFAVLLLATMAEAQARKPSRRVAATPPPTVTEIMYHPANGGAEFIELQNPGGRPYDLSGFYLHEGIDYVFPPGSILAPGAYVVLVAAEDEDDFAYRYPGVAVGGLYSGRLSNGGDTIILSTSSDRALVALTYGDTDPWPAAADGNGYSLVIVDVEAVTADPRSWRRSAGLGGSPGADEGISFDPTEAMYALDEVLAVSIEIAEADWTALRYEGRNRVNMFDGDCLAEPFFSPFTYFPSTVTVDGVVAEQVGVRKKGFIGSLSRSKPALKLKFDKYIEGQRLSGLRRMTLNNTRQDPSYINQCFAYQVFAAAGVQAPRCNFAQVSVNGENLGLYVHVESIKKPFLARNFYRGDGNLYEGTLADFRPGLMGPFERKNNSDDLDRSDLEAVLDALQVSDAELVEALGAHIDLDAFFTFWATEVLLGHWDGHTGNTNNVYLYHNPENDLFYFIPWGADQLLTDEHPFGISAGVAGVYATSALARRLFVHAPTRQIYVERVLELLDTVWNEAALLAEINRMAAIIAPYLDPVQDAEFSSAVAQARRFVQRRRAQLLDLLQPQPLPWTEPLRELLCFPLLGELTASFETNWGTWGTANPYQTGRGSFSTSVSGLGQVVAVNAVAGFRFEPENASVATVLVVLTMANGNELVVVAETEGDLVASGVTLSIDEPPTEGFLYRNRPALNESVLIGLLGEGTIHFEAGNLTDGGLLRGTIEGLVYEPTF